MARIIGIDLGTTTSAISFLKDGKPEIIPNLEGERITDSVVGSDKYGNIITGAVAKRTFNMQVKEIKRKMGSSEIVNIGNRKFSPEEISAEILKKLKNDAEEFLGEDISEVIITVPAMFNSKQKAATIKAGELAGLKVERIISEPTAAALAYGIENLDKEAKILIYDFGGGTFDVSILDLDEGILDVIATSGDNELGGRDIDDILAEYIQKKSGLILEKGSDDEKKIKYEAEKIKKDLSSTFGLEFIMPEYGISLEISRDILEDLIKDLIERTFQCIDKAVLDSGLKIEDIDVVLPVGGTTRIPAIKERLKEKFGSKVKNFQNPQEVVAMGAAIQGGIKSREINPEEGIVITDICNYSLGINSVGIYDGVRTKGVFSPIISKHTTLPCSKSKVYITSVDNQERMAIEIYQGEEQMSKDNIKMGEFLIDEIPKKPAGEEKIKVTFIYDLNDILKVEAEIESNGKKSTFNLLKNQEGAEKEEVEKINEDDYKKSKYYESYRMTLEMAETKIKKVSPDNGQKIERLKNQIKQALTEENKEKIEKLEDELMDLLFAI